MNKNDKTQVRPEFAHESPLFLIFPCRGGHCTASTSEKVRQHFSKDRKQRVKLNGAYSDWLNVPAGVPHGTRLGPWLFLVLINDLRLPDGSFAMWKFADDTTVSEIVPPSKQSALQQAVDFISSWSQENRLQLNPSKCKELQSCFKRSPPTHSPVELDGLAFESVNSAKVLGVTIRDDFKWNDHISNELVSVRVILFYFTVVP